MQQSKKRRPAHLDEKGSLDIPHLGYHPLHHLHHHNMKHLEMLLLRLKIRLQSLVSYLLRLNKAHVIIASFAATSMLFGAYMYAFMKPVQMQMSYSAGVFCEDALTVLPNLHTTNGDSKSYDITMERPFSVAGLTLFSRSFCVTPTVAPAENSSETLEVELLGSGLFSKDISIENGQYPQATATKDTQKKTGINDTLAFNLSSDDSFFAYSLEGNNTSTACATEEKVVRCDLSELGLAQSNSYDLSLMRSLNGEAHSSALALTVTTNDALRATSASIENEATIYEKPSSIAVTFSEQLASLDDVTLTDSAGNQVPVTVTSDKKTATVTFANELARSTTFTLRIGSATSINNATLRSAFTTSFTTSGGPVALSSTATGYGFPQANAVVISFDSPIRNTNDERAKFTFTANGETVPATVTISGNSVTVDPVNLLPWCANFSVNIANGLVSEFGVGNGSGRAFTGRTICYTTEYVGASAEGRSITAYKFGSGSERVVFVGGTHGDEQSSVYILNSWIDRLDANATDIPSNRSVYVIPNVNPDGFAVGTRVNANGIDLNRNFPANNWKRDVIMPGGTLNVGGGGSNPLSEPESSALASYVLSLNPELVLTYHATGGLAISNESGDSTALALEYADLVGYTGLANSDIAGIFSHDITGAFEDWLHDAHSIPAILIELWTTGGNEIDSHNDALWRMVQH